MSASLQAFCLDLLQAGRQWRRLADAVVRPHGLSEATALPLILIGRQGGMRQTVLADTMGVEGPSLVRSLDQLCAAGLVIREEDGSDRRAKCLHLTQRGQGINASISRELDALRRAVFRDIEEADIEAGLKLFRRIAEAARSAAPMAAERVE